MQSRVLVIGSAMMEFHQRIKMIPRPGNVYVDPEGSYSWYPGGNASLIAISMARLGIDSVLCCRLGFDSNAVRLLKLYQKEGIDTRFVNRDPEKLTGLISVIIDESEEKRTMILPGASNSLSASEIEEAITCMPEAVIVHGLLPDNIVLNTANMCNSAGVPLILNACGMNTSLPLSSISKCEILLIDDETTYAYTNIHPTTPDLCLHASVALTNLFQVKYIIIKLGKQGSFLYDGKFYHIIPRASGTIVDPSGEEDVFVSALAARYVDGYGINDAVKHASIAAALCCGKNGTYASLPTKADISAIREKEEFYG